jgi:hypothetical protein
MTTCPGSASACSRAARLGGLADDRLLLGGAAAEQVADHDQPGRDADADLELGSGRRFEVGHRGDELEPGADRPLGVVLVCPGIPEVG